MPDTLTDRIERHEALAEAATPAPWTTGKGTKTIREDNQRSAHIATTACRFHPLYEMEEVNAAHIAANDPATIKAFCAVAKAAAPLLHEKNLYGEPLFPRVNEALAALYDALGGGR